MPQEMIFAPMGAMALLTFVVLLLIPLRRFRAGFAGEVGTDDFKFGESTRVPGHVAIPNRNYMNLLELPMLFYVAGLMYFVAGRVDGRVLTAGPRIDLPPGRPDNPVPGGLCRHG